MKISHVPGTVLSTYIYTPVSDMNKLKRTEAKQNKLAQGDTTLNLTMESMLLTTAGGKCWKGSLHKKE